FEDAIAKRLDLDLGALRDELSGERPRGAAPRPPPPRAVPPRRPAGPGPRLLLPGPAADALGLLAAFPQLAPVAEEEDLPSLLPDGPLAELARDLIHGRVAPEAGVERLSAVADAATVGRVRGVRPEDAEREMRRGALKAKLERIAAEMAAAERHVIKAGSAGADGVALEYQRLVARKRDLEKRLRSLGRSG
ncbi:MAG TPA: DNA primase, partial [Vicinamibacteria bacterium]